MFKRGEMSFDALSAALHTNQGLIELVISALCVFLGWRIAKYVYRHFYMTHPERSEKFCLYILQRLALPISSQILVIVNIVIWYFALGYRPNVLQLVSALLFWMSVIRLLAAVVRQALPRGRFERTTEHFLSSILWLGFVCWAIGFDNVVLDWLQSISFSIGKTRLDLLMIINAILWVSLIIIGALWVSRVIESRLMRVKEIDLNLRIVISKVSRTVLIVAAVLIALPVVGIDLTVLSVFGGALGVGLGFGLQKIASNYVSGFIILLDRSIRIGDRLMIDNRVGIVTKITSRYVVLKSADGSESLIPNDTLISTTVINTSYSDRALWTSISVGVSYGSDLELAMKLLVEAAEHDRVLKDPSPSAFVVAFADSSINLELGFWVADPENGYLGLKSAINLAIWRKFKENGIEIPFPQREVKIINQSSN